MQQDHDLQHIETEPVRRDATLTRLVMERGFGYLAEVDARSDR